MSFKKDLERLVILFLVIVSLLMFIPDAKLIYNGGTLLVQPCMGIVGVIIFGVAFLLALNFHRRYYVTRLPKEKQK